MFPRLRDRIGTALLDRIDLLVEFSTLGEYGLAEDGMPLALDGPEAPSEVAGPAFGAGRVAQGPRSREDCPAGIARPAVAARPSRETCSQAPR